MSRKVDVCFLISFIASAFLLLGACAIFSSLCVNPNKLKDSEVKNEYVREQIIFYERPRWYIFEEHKYFMLQLATVPISVNRTRIILYAEYPMFITAYCAEECGWSYSTSSGETCHRSDWYHRYEPTTCAIDRSYFSYGTLFYIPSEDRVYIAEDTGPGVRGYWIDTYQDDMSDVIGYNTRYEYCYTCDIEEYSQTLYSSVGIQDVICNTNVILER